MPSKLNKIIYPFSNVNGAITNQYWDWSRSMLVEEALVPFSKMTDGISWNRVAFPEFRLTVSTSIFVSEISGCHLNNNAVLISGKVNRGNDIHIKQYDSTPKQLSSTIVISYLLDAKYLSLLKCCRMRWSAKSQLLALMPQAKPTSSIPRQS